MPLKLYNSLTRRTEAVTPRTPPKLDMFVCGPTVYDLVHLGNARTFTVFDVLARHLRRRGYDLTYLQNITDIDDKIIARAREQGEDPLGYARRFENEFRADMQALGNVSVDQYPRATDHIPQVTRQVKALREKGHVYAIEGDGWYFDLASFSDYGKLSGRTGLQADDAVSRIDENDRKRNRGDFCVWKLSRDGEPSWPEQELGDGRPGWHIEDTAITEHYFGPQYDLHGGAVDLMFPHHEAEIAQQEAASGKVPFVRHWVHAGFLQATGERMGKSKGNFITLREALNRWPAEALRFFFLSNHYRSPLEYSERSVDGAAAAVNRIAELLWKVSELRPSAKDDSVLLTAVGEAEQAFGDALDDDLNTAAALAAVFTLIGAANKALAEDRVGPEAQSRIRAFFAAVHDELGIVPAGSPSLPDDIRALVDEREQARANKDFGASDRIRGDLTKLGYSVDDTAYGPLIKKKPRV